MSRSISRRHFIKTSAAAGVAAPAILTSKRSAAQDVIGDGELKFKCEHHFPQLPDEYAWQTTHNVAVDPDNNLYVIHEGKAQLTDHPSIFVFDSEGKFIRSFGNQFQGGGHGIEVRVEDGTPFPVHRRVSASEVDRQADVGRRDRVATVRADEVWALRRRRG